MIYSYLRVPAADSKTLEPKTRRNDMIIREAEPMKTSLFRILLIMLPPALLAAAFLSAADKKDAELVRELENTLIAPCCWSQPVSQHYSEVSEKIRKEVREMVAAGKSRDEILDHYVSEYGERILATPRPRGFNVMAYVLPWAALILGAWLLFALLRKLRAPAPAAVPSPLPDARYASIVEKEIQDLDE
jgi:cytochrome c-type biogenesis protein CcmH